MDDILENMEIIQFIIISLFILYKNNKSETDKILDNDSKYYKFLLNIIYYNNITRNSIENNIKNKINKLNNDIFLKNNEYFYIFTNQCNLYVYFFQEKISKKHFIYFNGFNNLKDIKTIFNLLTNNLTYNNIKNTLHENGIFYKIIDDKVQKLIDKKNIINIFDYIYDNIYKHYKINNKISISINGYSLGGPYSQVFINLLFDKYNDLDIELYNLESWFFGNEKTYNDFKNKIKIYNIYNDSSILYFYNNIFQDYNKCSHLLNDNNKTCIKYLKYLLKQAPFGIIKYTKDHHMLSKIIK